MSELDPEPGKRERDTLERLDAALPRTRDLLLRLARQGVQRVTPATATELRAAAQVAHAAGAIRIERELSSLANHVDRYLERDPIFRPRALVAAVNRVWLLLEATRRGREEGSGLEALRDLLGEARRAYDPVEGRLEVHPLAAVGWVSDTDFVGVTVHAAADGWPDPLQISVVRPTMGFGRDPRRLMSFVPSESAAVTTSELAHASWTMTGARLSRDGRLSLQQGVELGPAPPRGLAVYARFAAPDWIGLVDRIGQADRGLLEAPAGCLAYLEPAAWGRVRVDDKVGTARLALSDRRGAELWASIPLAAHHNLWVDNLEILGDPAEAGARPEGLFGRAWISGEEVGFTPWTAVYHRERSLQVGRARRRVHAVHLSVEALATLGAT